MRLTSILLSGLLLFQSLHLGIPDLAQLDELLEHAQYHHQQYGDSFLTFLTKHYGEQKPEHQQEHQEHEQLPFQHLPHQYTGHMHYYMIQRFLWIGPSEIQESQLHLFHYHLRTPGVFEKGVFQPPRYC